MNINKHKISTDAEKGIWREYDGARFLIAASKTKTYQAAATKAIRAVNQNLLKAQPELYAKLANKTMATHVLLDWEGVNDGETPIPYSKENALMLLESAPDFREWVSDEAGNLDNFKAEALADDTAAVKSGA